VSAVSIDEIVGIIASPIGDCGLIAVFGRFVRVVEGGITGETLMGITASVADVFPSAVKHEQDGTIQRIAKGDYGRTIAIAAYCGPDGSAGPQFRSVHTPPRVVGVVGIVDCRHYLIYPIFAILSIGGTTNPLTSCSPIESRAYDA
jgi:hypothetical protein